MIWNNDDLQQYSFTLITFIILIDLSPPLISTRALKIEYSFACFYEPFYVRQLVSDHVESIDESDGRYGLVHYTAKTSDEI